MSSLGIVLVTTGSKSEAQQLANILVKAQLAACVSIMPIESIYRWQEEIHHDDEYQLLIKTDLTYFEQLANEIRQHHTYENPEIIALPIVRGSQAYLGWMQTQVCPEAD